MHHADEYSSSGLSCLWVIPRAKNSSLESVADWNVWAIMLAMTHGNLRSCILLPPKETQLRVQHDKQDGFRGCCACTPYLAYVAANAVCGTIPDFAR